MIRAARGRAATAVNVELVLLYWHIGDRIGRDILKEERAPYGKRILSTLSKELIADYIVLSRVQDKKQNRTLIKP